MHCCLVVGGQTASSSRALLPVLATLMARKPRQRSHECAGWFSHVKRATWLSAWQVASSNDISHPSAGVLIGHPYWVVVPAQVGVAAYSRQLPFNGRFQLVLAPPNRAMSLLWNPLGAQPRAHRQQHSCQLHHKYAMNLSIPTSVHSTKGTRR